ncbi:hypothetical protein TraAM80_07933 [Trypanosoma rangeli]|uniref:Secreted protein n=1 Tax=Trypanosoma rangeli TaxID=5698 RepID=A0A422N359_TRYRA|nr:uncharacterized protein TraAM80_07933 [Trypanosoma rangeli]RNE99917.1 hypothetical protein TraAM80_07933 [Trypanosoma rangeli]|eukprot:RNE99917.1 hypothetical protein TraAM80_07933 [Trypanosoma rangeli]
MVIIIIIFFCTAGSKTKVRHWASLQRPMAAHGSHSCASRHLVCRRRKMVCAQHGTGVGVLLHGGGSRELTFDGVRTVTVHSVVRISATARDRPGARIRGVCDAVDEPQNSGMGRFCPGD